MKPIIIAVKFARNIDNISRIIAALEGKN